ncbi:acyl-CoA carboxylase subunit epsilon [Solwaraspora sp. WMMD1047]|uniref:acyl-CoA carboxylase subunit epsilon n=1 Tax=Solwaraspora sp. WMMD1047 TaxID=3016102 RepID=UPI002417EDD8|nr:acyl-CoA carboxylase subunit epsilon [Solwaraspora sp. WMMD1047]MDG4833321.1 acyl-CoA carboxylase subunit epsilon [Solwaraspora sp. WMMD1047]
MPAEQEPVFRVVRGVPTAQELAALVGVLGTRRPTARTAPPAVSTWARSARPGWSRMPARACPDAWRSSGLPR